MQFRFLLPTLGGIFGIFLARGQEASTLETFGAMAAGMLVGWAFNKLLSKSGA